MFDIAYHCVTIQLSKYITLGNVALTTVILLSLKLANKDSECYSKFINLLFIIYFLSLLNSIIIFFIIAASCSSHFSEKSNGNCDQNNIYLLTIARIIYDCNVQRTRERSVAVRSKAWVCGRSLTGIVGSNPTGGMDVCVML